MLLKPNKPENLVSSYRPISLTSCLAKCFEKIILNRVVKHLKTNKNVSIFQSGFREGHSTKDHILRLTQNIQNNFNSNQYTGTVMFDLEKAFDRVWHKRLFFKLNKLELPNYLLYWIHEFITFYRTFYVQINDCFSKKCTITAGVPQGCILSPILFSIYFSDISEEIDSEKALYADDLAIWATG